MKKRIIPIMLALFLTLCVVMLNITPAAFAVTYGETFVLGNINGIGKMTGVTYIDSLIYNQNHTVYGVTFNSSSTHLFAVNLDSNGGYYPLTAATAVTDLGVPPNGVWFTPFEISTVLPGHALTAGYNTSTPSSPTHDLAIYGGGTVWHRPAPGAADLVVYDIDAKTFYDLGRPTCLPPSLTPLDESVFALATGIDGTIYGGTGYWFSIPPHGSDFTYLFAYNPTSNTFTLLHQVLYASDYFISQLATGLHGEIYFLSQPSGTLWVYEPQTGVVSAISGGNYYTALTVDLHGNVWLCDHSGNLYEYTPLYPPISGGTLMSYGSIVIYVGPPTPTLNIYGMAAGTHGIICMAAYDGTRGCVEIYDPRSSIKPWNPGLFGTNGLTTNPGSALPPLSGFPTSPLPPGTIPYSLVECNEHGTIFGATSGSTPAAANLFYYYESGNPDINNDGIVNILDVGPIATQWLWDPPTTFGLSAIATTHPPTTSGLSTAAATAIAFAVILGVQKRQKKKT